MAEDVLSKKGIKKYLSNDDYKIEVYESLESTNALLKGRAQKGENEWTVVIADSQTCGRGRMTRKFYSPKKRSRLKSRKSFYPKRTRRSTIL